MVTAVLGASSDPDRYSSMCMSLLIEKGHTAIPVHPRESSIQGQKVWKSLNELARAGQNIDTVTVYINSALSTKLLTDFVQLNPSRVIINPGAENPILVQALKAHGIEVVHGCSLVMLRTGQY